MASISKVTISKSAREHLDNWLEKANQKFDAGIVDGPLVVSELVLELNESRIEEFQKKSFDVKKLLKNMLDSPDAELDVSKLIERLSDSEKMKSSSSGLMPRQRRRRGKKGPAAQTSSSDGGENV